MNITNTNKFIITNHKSIQYSLNEAFEKRGLFTRSLPYDEAYALRKIPVYSYSGRYTHFSPYFPVFAENHWEPTLRLINELAKTGTITRMLKDPLFKESFCTNFFKHGVALFNFGSHTSPKTRSISGRGVRAIVRNIRNTCPAFLLWLKNKTEPIPPPLELDGEEIAWLNLTAHDSEEIDGHGLIDVVSYVGSHIQGCAPYVIGAVATSGSSSIEECISSATIGIGAYAIARGIRQQLLSRETIEAVGEGLAAGAGKYVGNPCSSFFSFTASAASNAVIGPEGIIPTMFRPIFELFTSVDDFCVANIPLWGHLPQLLRYIVMAFIGAATLSMLYRTGHWIAHAAAGILSGWFKQDSADYEIVGHSFAPIACATMLFSVVSMNYEAVRGFNMFKSLYGTLKVLENDFSVESTFKKWTNKLCNIFGLDDVFTTATFLEEWDRVQNDFNEIEMLPNLESEMVNDFSLPTRIRTLTKEMIELERAMRSCRQVPANYKTTAAATVLRAVRLTREVFRKNARFCMRDEPIWFDFRGLNGGGKTVSGSLLVAMLFQCIHGREISAGDRCSKAPSSQYWNGYHESIFAVILDEFCSSSLPDKNLFDVMFILNAVGTDFCPLDMADVESKGTMGFCSPIIMSTGNGDYSYAPIQDKGALQRRVTFPLKVSRRKDLPAKPTMADVDEAWVFTPTDDWIAHPNNYKGVWHELKSDVPLAERTWKFSEIMTFSVNALRNRKESKPLSVHAEDLVKEMAIPNQGVILGHSKKDAGVFYNEEDESEWYVYSEDTIWLRSVSEDGVVSYDEVDVDLDQPYVGSQSPHVLGTFVVHAMGMPARVRHHSAIVPCDSPDGDKEVYFQAKVSCNDKGKQGILTIPRPIVSFKTGSGAWKTLTWPKLFEAHECGVVHHGKLGHPLAIFTVYALDEAGGSFFEVNLTPQQVEKQVQLGRYFIYVEDDDIPYLVHPSFEAMDETGYGYSMRKMDAPLHEWMVGPFMQMLTSVREWGQTITSSQIIAIAAGVPLAIGAFLALKAALTPGADVAGHSEIKDKPEYMDSEDLMATARSRARVFKYVRTPKEDMPHHYKRHYDVDWYDNDIDGHSATDPTVIVNNMRRISVSGTNSVCWAMLLDSTTLITVRHIFCSGGSIKLYTTSQDVRSTTYLPSMFDVVFCDGTDMCMVVFKKPIISIKSIWKHIGGDYEMPRYTRRLTPTMTKGVISSVVSKESAIRLVDGSFVIKQVPENLRYPVTFYAQVDDPTTKIGDCGLPYLVNIGGSDKIIGLHFGGHRGVSCMALFNADLLAEMRGAFGEDSISAHASPLATVLDPRVVPNLPGADVVGIIDHSKVPAATQPPNRMRHTELQEQGDEEPPDFTLDLQPASLRGKVALKATDFLKRGETEFDPLMEHLLSQDHWLLASINWTEFLSKPLEDPMSLRPAELLLGKPDMLKPASDKTSVGPLYKRGIYTIAGKKVQSKKELWCLEDEYVNEEFLRFCVDRVRNTQKGILVPTVVEARYKQELRDITAKGITLGYVEGEEVFRGNFNSEVPETCDSAIRGLIPREFYVSCPVDNYEIRALMWPYMERKHSLTNCNACQVGTNPYSIDWKIINDRTNKFKNLIILDVKSCDKTVMRVMEPAFRRKILHAYGAEDGTMMHTWINTLITKMFSYEAIIASELDGIPVEVIASFNESVASGLWVTTEMDGDWVYFIFRMAFEYLKRVHESAATWEDNVVILTYGDDNVGCVSDDVAPWYNRISISVFAYNMFGVVLTSLNKEPVIKETVPRFFDDPSDKEFLKRKFHHDKYSNSVLSPLAVSSIWGSLIWTAHGRMERTEAVDYYGQILRGALGEIVLHGVHAYNKFRDYFKPKYIALGGTWQPEWTFKRLRQRAVLRAKSSNIDDGSASYEQMLFLSVADSGYDPDEVGLEDSLLIDALPEA